MRSFRLSRPCLRSFVVIACVVGAASAASAQSVRQDAADRRLCVRKLGVRLWSGIFRRRMGELRHPVLQQAKSGLIVRRWAERSSSSMHPGPCPNPSH